ncbi:MAG: Ribonuclease VapC2 [Candidatus Ordinivivax streblomastigis]|uniref:Ribonuclease VapC2 n=1 Tax=Candidatus Ordinivivax streblomastigis TaxID=2540710 RepID=A0A5M8P0A3_9BACT|nr:MAG: Ribonuclease VapC2 [Candidatus Ordinivivax streblomastigis]
MNQKIMKKGLINCCISEITVAELYYGVECDSSNAIENKRRVDDFINHITVIPVSEALAVYAKEKYLLRKTGKLIDDMDIFIGATAIANNMILVTDNEKHLNRLSNIKIENWIEK